VKEISRLQTSRVVGLPLFIDQQWKLDASLLTEQRGVTRISQTDGYQLSALGLKRGLVFTQLRDMLAAEDSAVVAKENDHGRIQLPE
jgi:hypothetical protein